MSEISEYAMMRVDELNGEGLALTPEEIVQLNNLGLRVQNLPERVDPTKAGRPVRAGNVWLWPMTLAASGWFFEVALEHYKTEQGHRYAMAFALAHGRWPALKIFRGLCGERRIRRAVNRWGARCGATDDELNAAIHRVMPELAYPHSPQRACASASLGGASVLAELEAATGKSPDYWAGQSTDRISLVINAIYAQRAAGVGGAAQEGDEDLYRSNMAAFNRVVDAIRASRATTDGK